MYNNFNFYKATIYYRNAPEPDYQQVFHQDSFIAILRALKSALQIEKAQAEKPCVFRQNLKAAILVGKSKQNAIGEIFFKENDGDYVYFWVLKNLAHYDKFGAEVEFFVNWLNSPISNTFFESKYGLIQAYSNKLDSLMNPKQEKPNLTQSKTIAKAIKKDGLNLTKTFERRINNYSFKMELIAPDDDLEVAQRLLLESVKISTEFNEKQKQVMLSVIIVRINYHLNQQTDLYYTFKNQDIIELYKNVFEDKSVFTTFLANVFPNCAKKYIQPKSVNL